MRYEAEIVGLSELIDEEVTVRVGSWVITGFAAACPYRIEVGRVYPVEFELWALDGLVLQEAEPSDVAPQLCRRGSGFGYLVVGYLEGRVLDAGLKFEDAIFEQHFACLSGRKVRVEVDRIQVDFLVE